MHKAKPIIVKSPYSDNRIGYGLPIRQKAYSKDIETALRYGPDSVRNTIFKDIETVNLSEELKEEELNTKTCEKFEQYYAELYKSGRLPVTIGGGHGISVPATIALSKMHENISTVRLDRDIDALGYSPHGMSPFEWAYPFFDDIGFYMILHSIPNINALHIGSYYDSDSSQRNIFRENSLGECVAQSINAIKAEKKESVQFITKKCIKNCTDETNKFLSPVKGMPLYLSIDVDAFGFVNAYDYRLTKVPYGTLELDEFRGILKTLVENTDIKGIDITEINTLDASSIKAGEAVISAVINAISKFRY